MRGTDGFFARLERREARRKAAAEPKPEAVVVPPTATVKGLKHLRPKDAVGRDTSGIWYTDDTKVVTCCWCDGIAVASVVHWIGGRPYCPACLAKMPDDAYLEKHDLPVNTLYDSYPSWFDNTL